MHRDSLLKRMSRSAPVMVAASALIGAYIWLVQRTARIEFIGMEEGRRLDAEGGFILAFWHSRLLMAPIVRAETRRDVYMLVSANRDGEMIANGVRRFGIKFIRGSAANPRKLQKDKSGAPALAQMVAALKTGGVVGFTPDGPRGPRATAQRGIIKLSQVTGAPILPGAYAASWGWTLNTWDRFYLPGPFARIAFVCGPAIAAPASSDVAEIEAVRVRLENALNSAVTDAETAVGRAQTPERSPKPGGAG